MQKTHCRSLGGGRAVGYEPSAIPIKTPTEFRHVVAFWLSDPFFQSRQVDRRREMQAEGAGISGVWTGAASGRLFWVRAGVVGPPEPKLRDCRSAHEVKAFDMSRPHLILFCLF